MFSNILNAPLQFSVALFSPLRLGSGAGDSEDIKVHPFFDGLDWKALENKQIPPPWKPTLMNETDTSYFNKKYTYADIDEATPPVRISVSRVTA